MLSTQKHVATQRVEGGQTLQSVFCNLARTETEVTEQVTELTVASSTSKCCYAKFMSPRDLS